MCSLTIADGGSDTFKIFSSVACEYDPDLRICQSPFSRALNEAGVTPETPREQPGNSGIPILDLCHLSLPHCVLSGSEIALRGSSHEQSLQVQKLMALWRRKMGFTVRHNANHIQIWQKRQTFPTDYSYSCHRKNMNEIVIVQPNLYSSVTPT